jgi:hypothetical protein
VAGRKHGNLQLLVASEIFDHLAVLHAQLLAVAGLISAALSHKLGDQVRDSCIQPLLLNRPSSTFARDQTTSNVFSAPAACGTPFCSRLHSPQPR